jgi:signal transduction histidine kinase
MPDSKIVSQGRDFPSILAAKIMSGWTKRFERQSRTLVVLATLLIVGGVGLIDYVTGWELSFSVFYLLALGIATWFVGTKFALFISVLSVAVSLAGDLATGGRYSSRLVPWWNAFIMVTFYIVVVVLLARLRALYGELEGRVKQRTAALTDEMTERERIERELLEISEREQRRIGHDLHDSLGQHLTGVALAGQVLEEKLTTQGLPEAADASKIVELVEEGIALSRKLAKGLHPVEMEADGLMQALEDMAAISSDLFKASCRFECDSPVIIRDTAISGHLYRIAQEAISNAVKHGKARNITIQLEALDDAIALRVKDDGTGLPDSLPKTAGIGLRIMAHRASIIGATFQARRDDPRGTIVSCVLRHQPEAKKDSSE